MQGKEVEPEILREQGIVSFQVRQAMLMHALQLRRDCREVFLLCDVQQCSLAEAAVILGISEMTAKRRLLTARRRMQDSTRHLCEGQYD